jgi:hypothetical protein
MSGFEPEDMDTFIGFRASQPMTPEQIRRSKSINQLRSRYTYLRTHPAPVQQVPFGGMGIALDLSEDMTELLGLRQRIDHLVRKYRRERSAETDSD